MYVWNRSYSMGVMRVQNIPQSLAPEPGNDWRVSGGDDQFVTRVTAVIFYLQTRDQD